MDINMSDLAQVGSETQQPDAYQNTVYLKSLPTLARVAKLAGFATNSGSIWSG